MTRLESRYRRWLACYPKAYREDHEAELLAVLVAVSRDGRQRPSPGELLASSGAAWACDCCPTCHARPAY
ncbi:MAG TPA: hypothetical protein VFX16_37775 [Pseudonocardiaceae bacterium]|nr:hypothetical protein [Pseudonocardiaceae bacterium]